MANDLNRFTMGSLSHFPDDKINLVKEIHKLTQLGVWLESSPNGVLLYIRNLNHL